MCCGRSSTGVLKSKTGFRSRGVGWRRHEILHARCQLQSPRREEWTRAAWQVPSAPVPTGSPPSKSTHGLPFHRPPLPKQQGQAAEPQPPSPSPIRDPTTYLLISTTLSSQTLPPTAPRQRVAHHASHQVRPPPQPTNSIGPSTSSITKLTPPLSLQTPPRSGRKALHHRLRHARPPQGDQGAAIRSLGAGVRPPLPSPSRHTLTPLTFYLFHSEAWRYKGNFTRFNRFRGSLPGLGTATVAFAAYCAYEHFFLKEEHHHAEEGHH